MGNPPLIVGLLINGVAYAAIFIVVAVLLSRFTSESEGYEVIEEVADPGQSGASLERPGMDRVRDLVAAGGVAVVLAQDRDRFSREPAYHYLLRREFEEHETRIRALNDRGDESPEGQLTDGILDQLAKFERAKTMERSRRGKLRKARGRGRSSRATGRITASTTTQAETATR